MWPHRFPGASGPGRPRDRHTRAYGSEWSISKPARALRTLRRPPAPSTPVGSRRPLIGRYLVCSADVPGASGPGRPLAVGAACCCLWHRWCSGRLRARPPARSPHASLRLGVVDLEARPCPPDPPAPSTPVGSRRPPIGRYLVCMYLARPCRRPQAPRPGLLTTLPQQTVRKTQTPPVVTVVVSWFPNNVACNSPTTLSNFEFTSLKFQRFQTLLKRQPIELHAKFRGALPHGAKRGACRVRPGSLSRRARRARRGRPCLSPGARRAPGAWREPRRAASRHSDTPTPPTRRPSRSSGTSARPRGR